MNIYLVVIQENSAIPHEKVTETFPERHHKIRDGVWVVAGNQKTCGEVRLALDMHGKADHQPATGVVFKVTERNGYAASTLWEKLGVWIEEELA